MTSISFSQIQYVLALEKTGNFSEAAALCFVTQSTLSTMIKRYEDQIGFQIFNRKTKPISLTPEGQALIHQLKVIRHEYDNLTEIIKATKGEVGGTFYIGIIPTIAPFLLPRFLNKLIQTYPNIEFVVHEITTEEIVKKIKIRELDVGIVSIPLKDPELREVSLFVEDFVVYDTRKKANAKKYSIADIDLNRLWLLEEGHCMRNQVATICNLRKQKTSNNNLVYNSGSILSLIEFVKISDGITLLPRLSIDNNPLLDASCIYPLVDPTPTREIGLITHSNFAKHRFLKILATEIGKVVEQVIELPEEFVKVLPF